MTNVSNNLTEWRNLLQQAVAPLNNGTAHQYIIDTAGHHTITANPNLKLSIKEIVTTSISVIEGTREERSSNLVKIRTDIADLTERLIEARVNKREKYAFLRAVARIICLFSVVAYRYYDKLKKEDVKFKEEITQLNALLEQAVFTDRAALSLTKGAFETVEAAGINEAEIQAHFQARITERFAAHRGQDGVVHQFAADIRRGYQFQLNDLQGSNIDNTVQPSQTLSEEGRVESALTVLHQINSPEWEIAIQSACNQLALTSTIEPMMSSFNFAAIDTACWTEGENLYSLQLAFNPENSPFNITVIRNPETNVIDSIQFAVEKSVDIKRFAFSDNSTTLADERAITTRVTYTLTLSSSSESAQRSPIIQNMHLTTVVNFGDSVLNQNAVEG